MKILIRFRHALSLIPLKTVLIAWNVVIILIIGGIFVMFANLQSEQQQLAERIDLHRSNLWTVTDRLNDTIDQVENINDEVFGLWGLEGEVDDLNRTVSDLQWDVYDIQYDIAGLQSDLYTVEWDVWTLKNEMARLSSKVTQLSSKVETLWYR